MMGSQHGLSDTRPGSPLQVDTDVGGAPSANQYETYEAWLSEDIRRSKATITGPQFPVNTGVGGALSANQGELSVEADARGSMSPILRPGCDGWCGYDLIPRATVVSIDSPAWCG
jgi:hypothetical protein